jgi:streptogramin lyase
MPSLANSRRYLLAVDCAIVGLLMACFPSTVAAPAWAVGICLVVGAVLMVAPNQLLRILGAAVAAGIHAFCAAMLIQAAFHNHGSGLIGATELATVTVASIMLLFTLLGAPEKRTQVP